MSVVADIALALGRALLLAVVAMGICGALCGWLAAQSGPTRTGAWVLLLAPFFVPPALIGAAFSNPALAVSPSGREIFYLTILALKLVPLAVVVRTFLPSRLSAEARFVFHALGRSSWKEAARFHLRGAGPGLWIAGAVVFLLAFTESELATLFQVRTWTVLTEACR